MSKKVHVVRDALKPQTVDVGIAGGVCDRGAERAAYTRRVVDGAVDGYLALRARSIAGHKPSS